VPPPYARTVFKTVALRDGRVMEYADLGDPTGRPVLFLPGTPATAGQAVLVADAAHANGVRLIAVSRPGYGASTNTSPGLTSTAGDALDLADQLGIGAVVAMGASGGGPFALALGALAPDRVDEVVVLGGPGSHAEVTPEVLDEEDHRALELVADGDVEAAVELATAASQKFLGPLQGMSAEEFHAALTNMRPPGEDWFDHHPELAPAFEADFQRAITPLDGFVRDNLSWLGRWDFELATVTVPVRLIHGERDAMVPRAHGDWLHERLPDSRQSLVPGGHGHATFGAAIETFAELASG
jgi:pimeloyl-ACP methyl ester carboxylesterase